MDVLKQLHVALADNNFPSRFNVLNISCKDSMCCRFFQLALKSRLLVFQLLPDFPPANSCQNIVIVVCPLTSIIEDQISALKLIGITGFQQIFCQL